MAYTVKRNLTTTIENDHYLVEFDGQDVYVHDKENHRGIVYSGSMDECVELATLLYGIRTEVNRAEVVTKDES